MILRFTILAHDFPFEHWDLLLETEDQLKTWRLQNPPRSGLPVGACPLPDHRRLYLDYEGPVSGNRGRVARWETGCFVWRLCEADQVWIDVRGHRLCGRLELSRRTQSTEQTGEWTWELAYVPADQDEWGGDVVDQDSGSDTG